MDLTATWLDLTDLYRDGGWHRAASNERITVVNPTDGHPFGTVPDCGPADVDTAVRSARTAFDRGPWRGISADERANLLVALAEAIDERAHDFAVAGAREIGQPLVLSRARNAEGPARQLRYYAELLRERVVAETRPARNWPGDTLVRREPLGVAALVVPWNYPQSLTMTKLAPALAAGCTVVIKPAPEASVAGYLLAEACAAAGLPPGVVNLVPGGRGAGAALVAHPGIDTVAFTGSTAAGRAIAEVCGRLLRPVTLELGGKSAALVLVDADPGEVSAHLARITFGNTGQTCFAQSRVLVPRARSAEFIAALVAGARQWVLGDPFDPATTMGPLISERQRDRVHGLVTRAVGDGATLITGGRALHRPGWFYEPTVLAGVDNGSEIAQEEIFGPVVCVITYDDVDHAVALANASRYGLGGSVYTADPAAGLAVACRIESGTVGVNGYGPDLAAPFGGWKTSGLGSEYGPESIAAYERVQSVFRPAA